MIRTLFQKILQFIRRLFSGSSDPAPDPSLTPVKSPAPATQAPSPAIRIRRHKKNSPGHPPRHDLALRINDLLCGSNPEQRSAIIHSHKKHGPLLVLAGAGSGKTSVLTKRLTFLRLMGVRPGNILALTFTKKAAAEMAERAQALCEKFTGSDGNGGPMTICTFHSLALRILRDKPGGIANFSRLGFSGKKLVIIEESRVQALLREAVKEIRKSRPQGSPPLPLFEDIVHTVERMRNLFGVPEKFNPEKAGILDNGPFYLDVWRAFNRKKKELGLIDFGDMVSLCLELLENHAEVRRRYRERFRFIHIDEYQDTNLPQYRLSRLIAGGNQNIFIVGDDDQSIYRFRGADISNIRNFRKDYPGSRIIKLEINYRSTPNIITLSNSIFTNKDNGLQKIVKPNYQSTSSRFHENPKIHVKRFRREKDEFDFLVSEILRLKNQSSFEFSEMALLARVNDQVDRIRRVLSEKNVPVKTDGDGPGVVLNTLHSAKGLEYPVVFYTGLEESISPSFPRDKVTRAEFSEAVEEEKRLFYVGVTRAQYRLYLMSSRERAWYGKKRKFKRSRFFRHVPKSVVERTPWRAVVRDFLLEKPVNVK